jgi:hypothetical protein
MSIDDLGQNGGIAPSGQLFTCGPFFVATQDRPRSNFTSSPSVDARRSDRSLAHVQGRSHSAEQTWWRDDAIS